MDITRQHLDFYDACKLQAAHEAHLASPGRMALVERFKKGQPKSFLSERYRAKEPTPIKTISIHALIPKEEQAPWRPGDRRAQGRSKARRQSGGKKAHLMRNLSTFIQSRMKHHDETFEEALEHFCDWGGGREFSRRTSNANSQPYEIFARRWWLGWHAGRVARNRKEQV